jgi:cobalt-zinc-cadmium resistance protein CzcA
VVVSDDVERLLRTLPEVTGVVNQPWPRPHEATETMALNQGDVYVLLAPRSKWRVGNVEGLIELMDSALTEIPGPHFRVLAPMRMRLDEVVSGVKDGPRREVYGDSLELLQQKGG